ncbi:NAD(P)-binding domain-containing protein [Neolewinella lacunae]|uniref:NAD(P)-binding domain-containing protein n=1 Tax=Neolewinella lacunae TaxID=1517758 RepID=A0A923PLQ2_9BACT|nr:NAD(P)-binding domain-containing protein [Neolewinella lacunae]MBC6995031.1 NAD(P)-binding domain-containing protein [Neolewinella lacunae]MDN3633198.1 NAD(P)-binding domain-containing protein [Neolewinella lacunae]
MKKDTKDWRIAIIGCGWLGLPLLADLVAAGYTVAGTSRSPETLSAITAAGGTAWSLQLPEPPPAELLRDCKLVIVTLPPGGRQLGEAATGHYLDQLRALLAPEHFDQSPAVLYTSSTGVYGSTTGRVTEATPVAPDSASSRAVVAAEAWLTEHFEHLTILRLAGLAGPGRHPGRFYGGRDRPIPEGDAPVNLVVQQDVIAAIRHLLAHDLPTGTFNVCAAAHPPKGTFYTAAAAALGLPVAGQLAGGADGKVVDSTRLRRLGWQPRFDALEGGF